MDVRPLVIPHSQAAKLTEPGKRALHDPARGMVKAAANGDGPNWV